MCDIIIVQTQCCSGWPPRGGVSKERLNQLVCDAEVRLLLSFCDL